MLFMTESKDKKIAEHLKKHGINNPLKLKKKQAKIGYWNETDANFFKICMEKGIDFIKLEKENG